MSKCETCQKKPFHPDKKCCFNCGRADDACGVWHTCGEDCPGWKPKKQTIADQIRSMTDEELAKWLLTPADLCGQCDTIHFCTGCPQDKDTRCIAAVIKYLKQPVGG